MIVFLLPRLAAGPLSDRAFTSGKSIFLNDLELE